MSFPPPGPRPGRPPVFLPFPSSMSYQLVVQGCDGARSGDETRTRAYFVGGTKVRLACFFPPHRLIFHFCRARPCSSETRRFYQRIAESTKIPRENVALLYPERIQVSIFEDTFAALSLSLFRRSRMFSGFFFLLVNRFGFCTCGTFILRHSSEF